MDMKECPAEVLSLLQWSQKQGKGHEELLSLVSGWLTQQTSNTSSSNVDNLIDSKNSNSNSNSNPLVTLLLNGNLNSNTNTNTNTNGDLKEKEDEKLKEEEKRREEESKENRRLSRALAEEEKARRVEEEKSRNSNRSNHPNDTSAATLGYIERRELLIGDIKRAKNEAAEESKSNSHQKTLKKSINNSNSSSLTNSGRIKTGAMNVVLGEKGRFTTSLNKKREAKTASSSSSSQTQTNSNTNSSSNNNNNSNSNSNSNNKSEALQVSGVVSSVTETETDKIDDTYLMEIFSSSKRVNNSSNSSNDSDDELFEDDCSESSYFSSEQNTSAESSSSSESITPEHSSNTSTTLTTTTSTYAPLQNNNNNNNNNNSGSSSPKKSSSVIIRRPNKKEIIKQKDEELNAELNELRQNKKVRSQLTTMESHLADQEVFGRASLQWNLIGASTTTNSVPPQPSTTTTPSQFVVSNNSLNTNKLSSSSEGGGTGAATATGVVEEEAFLLQSGSVLGPIFSHATVGYKHNVIVIGGKNHLGNGTSDFKFFNVGTTEWFTPKVVCPEEGTVIRPSGIFGHAVSRIARDIYVIGGYETKHSSPHKLGLAQFPYKISIISPDDSVVLWSRARFSISEDFHFLPRVGHTIVRHKSKLIMFGGHNGAVWTNDVIILNTLNMDCSKIETLGLDDVQKPKPRGFHTATLVGHWLVVFGGTNGTEIFGDTFMLDIETMIWTKLTTPQYSKDKRHSISSTTPTLTSTSTSTSTSTITTAKSNINTSGTYKEPGARHCHAAVRVGQYVVLIGGKGIHGDILNDCWALDVETRLWTSWSSFCKRQTIRKTLGGAPGGWEWYGGWRVDNNVLNNNSNNLESSPPICLHTLTRMGAKLIIIGGKNKFVSPDIWIANSSALPLLTPNSSSSSSAAHITTVDSSTSQEEQNKSEEQAKIIGYAELEIFETVGIGHFSKVLRARYKGNDVAIKKIKDSVWKDNKEDLLRTFKLEIKLLSSAHHPNVIRLVGVCTKPKCIITEYLSHGSLRDFIKKQNESKSTAASNSILLSWKMDQLLRVKFAEDIAKGMYYLHTVLNIIHRDLKSHNLLIDQNWNIKICDFGISRVSSHTETMTSVGSVAWSAPEVLRKEQYNQKVDVYSYGVVLWELVSLKEPYEGMGRVEAAIAVATNGLRPPIPVNDAHHWKPEWVKLIKWCWLEQSKPRPNFKEILDYIAQKFY